MTDENRKRNLLSDDQAQGFTITCEAHFQVGERGRKKMEKGLALEVGNSGPGRIPRISKLMALAIHFDGLVKDGVVRDYADIARLGGISRARVTQIMNLLLLAPEIQEALLFLPRVMKGKDAITEHEMREVSKSSLWSNQDLLYQYK